MLILYIKHRNEFLIHLPETETRFDFVTLSLESDFIIGFFSSVDCFSSTDVEDTSHF